MKKALHQPHTAGFFVEKQVIYKKARSLLNFSVFFAVRSHSTGLYNSLALLKKNHQIYLKYVVGGLVLGLVCLFMPVQVSAQSTGSVQNTGGGLQNPGSIQQNSSSLQQDSSLSIDNINKNSLGVKGNPNQSTPSVVVDRSENINAPQTNSKSSSSWPIWLTLLVVFGLLWLVFGYIYNRINKVNRVIEEPTIETEVMESTPIKQPKKPSASKKSNSSKTKKKKKKAHR